MYEKRNNFREFTVNSVRQEIKNWIIIFLYIFGTSCPDEHTVGVCVIWTVFIVPRCRTRLLPIQPAPYQEREELTYVFQIKAFEQH